MDIRTYNTILITRNVIADVQVQCKEAGLWEGDIDGRSSFALGMSWRRLIDDFDAQLNFPDYVNYEVSRREAL